MTMLSDEKIKELAIKHFGGLSPEITLTRNSQRFARAVESAVREELAKQEPVAWMNPHGGVLQRLDTGIERETYTIPLYASPVVPDDMVQKLRDILQMLLQEPDTKAALFKAEDMLREVIAAAQESNAVADSQPD